MRAILLIGFLATPVLAAAPVLTLDSPPAPGPEVSSPLHEPAVGITGDWGGARKKLAEKGLTFGGAIQFDVSKNLRGGLDTEATVARFLLDLNATIDLHKACGIQGATLFIDLQWHDGRNGSDVLTGDVQGFNSIDAPHFFAIAQLWYQQTVNLLWVKVGKIDANTDFSVIDHGKDFSNTSFSYSATMYPMASYPNPAAGIELFYEPEGGQGIYGGAGAFYNNQDNSFLVFVGHPRLIERSAGGVFYIAEVGARWQLQKDALAGHAALGGWAHNGGFPYFPNNPRVSAERRQTGTAGGYALIDQVIWQEKERTVALFANYGWSDPTTNPMAQQAGGGISTSGEKASAGVGVSWAQLGHTPGILWNYEVAVEGYYKLELVPGAFIKPDVQYIVHPGGVHRDALVVTVRFEVDF